MLIGLAVLAVVVLAGIYVVLQQSGGGGGNKDKPPISQEAIDLKLGELQQDFQTALQENLDLARIEARAGVFVKDFPDQAGGHVLLAQTQMGLRKWPQAHASWGRALEIEGNAFELCKMAGFCAVKLGAYEDARQHYLDAVEASGGRADNEVFAALGRLHLTLGDDKASEQAFNQALQAPGAGEKTNWKHEAHSGLADVAAVRKDFEAAHASVDSAIRLGKLDGDADVPGYQIQKARLYLDAGKDEDAKTVLVYAWQAYPQSQKRIESARLRARLYERADELTRAVNHIALVCDTHQRDPERKDHELAELYALLAEWQIKDGQKDAARTSIHNLETVAPLHPVIKTLRDQLNQMPS